MNRFLESIGWMGRYLWAGWAGLSGIFCFLAAWQAGRLRSDCGVDIAGGDTAAVVDYVAAVKSM